MTDTTFRTGIGRRALLAGLAPLPLAGPGAAGHLGTFTQALYDEGKKQGWIVIRMKEDWKRIFAFGQPA